MAWRGENLKAMVSDIGHEGCAEGQGVVVGRERKREGEGSRSATNLIQVFGLRLFLLRGINESWMYSACLEADRRTMQVK